MNILSRRSLALPVLQRSCRVLAYSTSSAGRKEGWLFAESIFPVQVGKWDPRKYIAILRQDYLLGALNSRLAAVKSHDFQVLSVEPYIKDGGAFVRFSYSPDSDSELGDEASLTSLESSIREEVSKAGGLPSWSNLHRGTVWVVRGKPWKEDLDHYATPILNISFSDGPDVPEQSLWDLLRPYGRIKSMKYNTQVPSGVLRSSSVYFSRLRAATVARNVLHNFTVPTNNGQAVTRLKAAYDRPSLESHVIRNWLTSHPRIVLPVLVFLLGTLSYAIFDPLRVFMIQAKVQEWFDFKQYEVYKWVRSSAFGRFTGQSTEQEPSNEIEWKDRKEAREGISKYLHDLPTTVTFVHGPQGSGKSKLIYPILEESRRKYLVLDCRELLKSSSDSQLVTILARQTGYWPVFGFLSSMGHLFDLASVSMTGQKAGFSTSCMEQVQAVLGVAGSALKKVSSSHRKQIEKEVRREALLAIQHEKEEHRQERIRQGIWHDPRLDSLCGNGIMSELGIGDELFTEKDVLPSEAGHLVRLSSEGGPPPEFAALKKLRDEQKRRGGNPNESATDNEVVESLPILIIRNFASKSGDKREELLDVVAQWAASLVDNQIAHVIVLSDNRENAKRLAKALPAKPLNNIALYDADAASALDYVKQKLDMGRNSFTSQDTSYIEQLGGRASDLESLIHKVRSGSSVEQAFEDIVASGVAELRKNAFGDDLEDSKNLSWSREQAWRILKLLSSSEEVPYHEVLLDFPFKGDETALRNMESIDMITIGTHNGRDSSRYHKFLLFTFLVGRPSTIRPGRPVFKYVFERLAKDRIFSATQDIHYNDKVITSSESTIKACEEELLKLKELGADSGWFDGGSAVSTRARHLHRKLYDAEAKIQSLEKKNADLKKILSRGG